MVVVKKKKGESEDSLINRFRKKMTETGLLPEIRETRYEKPSEKKKKKMQEKKHRIEIGKKRNY